MRFRSARATALLLATITLTAPDPLRAGELQRFGPLCAKLDLEAIAVIERHEDDDLPRDAQERLAAAGLRFLAAREACLEGRVEAGAELYRGVLQLEAASASITK